MDLERRAPYLSAVGGGVVMLATPWLASRATDTLHEAVALCGVLLAALVLVPLSVPLFEAVDLRLAAWQRAVVVVGQPVAAGALLLSVVLAAPGPRVALALPWLGVSVVLATGILRHAPKGIRRADGACLLAAPAFLVAGAAGFVLWAGGTFLVGSADLTLLFALHFHHAGYVACLLSGLAGRALALGGSPAWGSVRWALWGVAVGSPLVAVGFLTSAAVRFVAVVVLSGSLVLMAFVVLAGLARVTKVREARWLLVASAASSIVAMALAWAYAQGEATGRAALSMDAMAVVHGPLNALGYGACGILAWTRLHRRA